MAHSTRGSLKRVATLIVYLLTAAALAWALTQVDWSLLRGAHLSWPQIALASVLALSFLSLCALTWRVILVGLGAVDMPRLLVLFDIFARAWMARYIPGGVPALAAKYFFATQHGLSKPKVAVSTILEPAAQVVGSVIAAIGLLALTPQFAQLPFVLRAVAVGSAVGLLVLINPTVFNRVGSLVMARLGRPAPTPVSWRLLASAIGLFAVAGLVHGASMAALASAVVPDLARGEVVYLVGAFLLAGIIGMLTPLLPSGLGTREAALLLLLLLVMPTSAATLVVVLSRVFLTLIDIVFWALFATLSRLPAIRGADAVIATPEPR